MSIFASETQKTVPLPFDQPQTVTVRKLTGREIDRAQDEHRRGIASGSGWAATFKRQLQQGLVTEDNVMAVVTNPLNGYSRHVLVECGLIAWTYPTTGNDAFRKKVADLDDEAVEFIAREVLQLTKPWLFQTAAEAEAGRKNG